MEVEVLDKVEVSELAQITTEKLSSQSIIINGQQQIVEQNAVVLYCPDCKAIIQ